MQEETYVASPVPVRVVASTAWFSLARQFLTQGRLGPFALVPAMTLQPVHPDAVAVALADAVEAGPGREKRQLVGPERLRADAMARDLATATGRRVPVVGVPYPGRAFRDQACSPRGGSPRTSAATPTGFDRPPADQENSDEGAPFERCAQGVALIGGLEAMTPPCVTKGSRPDPDQTPEFLRLWNMVRRCRVDRSMPETMEPARARGNRAWDHIRQHRSVSAGEGPESAPVTHAKQEYQRS